MVALLRYHRGTERLIEEKDLEGLTKYFAYTLECGFSYNEKINEHPKTLKSLISNINKSYQETQGGCYDQDSVREVRA